MNRRRRNSFFQCQQFRIEQSGAAMKVTTDACALGAWAPVTESKRILDIGTGSGLLALFAAQRAPDARIDAIELDPEAARQAERNFESSPFASRLTLIEGDITQYRPPHDYDTILCNPPFFSHSTRNSCKRLSQARHDTHLSLDTLLAAVHRLLAPKGHAYLLLPMESAAYVEMKLPAYDLHLTGTLLLISQLGDTPHRRVLKLSPEPGEYQESSLTLYTAHPIHSREAGRLFHPFYTRLRCEADEYSRVTEQQLPQADGG